MGARSPVNQRPRRGTIKCEFCSRSFPSPLSLRRHLNSLHASALKEKERKALSKKAGKIQKSVKAKVVVKPILNLVKAKPKILRPKRPVKKETPTAKKTDTVAPVHKAKVKKEIKKEQEERKVEMDLKPSTSVRKVEFKCPLCARIFPVYFSAKKHIQKHHNKVSLSKPVEPIRTEFCIFCNRMVTDAMEDHKCDSLLDLTGVSLTYVCTGCNHKFQSMRLFDIHIGDVHGEGVESMFFATVDEFNKWKDAMEKQTKATYLIMGKYNYKIIYRCSKTTAREDDEKTPAYFCPSTLIFQEFTKGIQVHFYKQHFGHSCPHYILQDQYKKYSLTDMLHKVSGYSEMMNSVESEENDLYCQFKRLMESIVVDAAKVNTETLKTLIGRALEMISVLKNYNVDDEDESSTLSISTSNQTHELTKALEALNNVSKATKRPITTSIEVVPVKRLNKIVADVKSPILQKPMKAKPTVNKFSLADDRDDQKILKELGGAKDSADASKVSSPIPMPVKKIAESPSFNDTYKNFVEKNLITPTLKTSASVTEKTKGPASAKKKTVVKTKMGQFKPNSPKKAVQNGTDVPSVRASRSSAGKSSDIKYEVKEQENDCNILILKI